MTVPNVFNSTARVATWDGAGIYDALIAEITANGAANGITITNSTATGALISFSAVNTALSSTILFSVRQGSTTNFISVGIAGDGTISGAGALATAPTGTGSDWSGEKEYDWTTGTPGTGSKMWCIFLDDALFVWVTNTANTFHTSALHFGQIYIPITGADDVANGRNGLGFMMGVPDALDNGTTDDWLQLGTGANSLVHMETGVWSEAGIFSNQFTSSGVIAPTTAGYSYTPPIPAHIGGYVSGSPSVASQKPIGLLKYLALVHATQAPLTVRPNATTNQGWLHFHSTTFAEDTVVIWDKTVTP